MNKISELASILVTKYGLSQKDAEIFVTSMFDVINDRLQNNERQVKIKGLGTFKLTSVSSRESVDINTGERILIEGRNKISFIPETSLKDRVNLPFSQFETVIINDGVDFSDMDPEKENTIIESSFSATESDDTVETNEENDNIVSQNKTVSEFISGTTSSDVYKQNDKNTFTESDKNTKDLNDKNIVCSETTYSNNEIVKNDNNNEQSDNINKSSNRIIYITSSFFLIVLIGVIGYGGYYFKEQLSIRDKKIQELNIIVNKIQSELNKKDKDIVLQSKSNVKNVTMTKPEQDTNTVVAEKAINVIKERIQEEENYNKDPRVRTGAYIISGIAKTVTVKKGETLSSLSRKYLGVGMECYVEAVNDKKEYKEGDKINIPKLKHKRVRKTSE